MTIHCPFPRHMSISAEFDIKRFQLRQTSFLCLDCLLRPSTQNKVDQLHRKNLEIIGPHLIAINSQKAYRIIANTCS